VSSCGPKLVPHDSEHEIRQLDLLASGLRLAWFLRILVPTISRQQRCLTFIRPTVAEAFKFHPSRTNCLPGPVKTKARLFGAILNEYGARVLEPSAHQNDCSHLQQAPIHIVLSRTLFHPGLGIAFESPPLRSFHFEKCHIQGWTSAEPPLIGRPEGLVR
jgi:hypothetical protein